MRYNLEAGEFVKIIVCVCVTGVRERVCVESGVASHGRTQAHIYCQYANSLVLPHKQVYYVHTFVYSHIRTLQQSEKECIAIES